MSPFDSYVISLSDSILLDKMAEEKNKISDMILMEEASEKIYNQLKIDFDLNTEKIAFICGWGNNAGDALSVARKIIFSGLNCDIYYFNDKQGTKLYNSHLEILKSINANLFNIEKLNKKIFQYTLIIDGLFGIGYKYRDDKYIYNLFNIINNTEAKVVSIDVPSGLDIENHNSIIADYTYSIGYIKDIFFNIDVRAKVGIIRDLKISFDINNIILKNKIIFFNEIIPLIRNSNNYIHKYKRGSCFFIGGSLGKLGAIIYSSESAFASGAGICLALTEKENIMPLNIMSKNIIFDDISNYKKHLRKYSTVLIGPGLELGDDNNKLLIKDIIKEDKQFVLDASFFSIFESSILNDFKKPPVLTPHSMEFMNFFQDESADLKSNTLKTVSNLSKKYKCFIVFKESFLIISKPDGSSYIFDNPNRLLAQAGSGDILAGMITGIISQGYDVFDSILEALRIFYKISSDLKDINSFSYSADDFISLIRRSDLNEKRFKRI
ncbi:MAG: NAD(P)H-hydrate epimerase [Spirochaetes bacterium]|nr:NAD(P)H-hydrate epimerase [Spirochaetota bacterium]